MARQAGYMGNIKLKKFGENVSITKENAEELAKCANDPVYFVKNYMKIVHVDHGLIPFDMWDFQEDMIRDFHEHRFNIVKFPRQTGKSTTAIGYLLWCVLFNDNYTVAILANKGSLSQELLGRLQRAYEYLPKWMQQGIVSWNKRSIELENESTIYAYATSASGVRGGTYNCISGKSTLDIKIDDEFFNLSIEQLQYCIANSSKNSKFINNSEINLLENIDVDVFKQQVYKMVYEYSGEKKHKKNVRSGKGQNSLEQRIEVKTELGYVSFHGTRKSIQKHPLISLSFDNGSTIECTPDHKIQTTEGWIEAKDCITKTIISDNGVVECVDIFCSEENYVFDLLEVGENHSFFANGISVHNCILLDEFAFVNHNMALDFFQSTYPVISSGETSKVIIVSTPNGMNLFYKMWTDAVEKRSLYNPIEVHWSQVPGRDEKWKEDTIRNTSEAQFAVEFESLEFSTIINIDSEQVSIGNLYESLEKATKNIKM